MRSLISSSIFATALALSAVASAQKSIVPAAFPTLRQGTPVMLLLDQTIDSAHSRVGTRVAFQVSNDVKIADNIVIPAGSSALGTVTQASHRGWVGKGSRVSVNIDAVRLPGGQVVALCTTPDLEDNGSGTVDDAIATSLASPPVSSMHLAAHRRDALIPEGTVVRAFIRRDTVVVQETASVSNR